MSSQSHNDQATPLDLSKWAKIPNLMIALGGLLAIIGLALTWSHDGGRQFGFAWLVGFIFVFSFLFGALFLVLVHHLFDANWSLPIRRTCENISSLLFPWGLVFFIPVALLAKKIYPWMTVTDVAGDHALHAKQPLLTMPGFYLSSLVVLLALGFIANQLRKLSIAQDQTGAAEFTHKMRRFAYVGIFLFAFLGTLGVILWVKSLQHQWFSTMFGVVFFAGSVWMTLATVYVITMMLARTGALRGVIHGNLYYFLGSLFFAFTVFYAYVTFSQYFIIWNANMPEETFWYVQREKGTWFWWSMIIIFGHFFLPFLGLLRIDVKKNFCVMGFFCIWAWLMHFTDMVFQILPVVSPHGVPLKLVALSAGCAALMLGILIKLYLAKAASAAAYPLKDPRLMESLGQLNLEAQPQGGK